jgi:dTMP kinase
MSTYPGCFITLEGVDGAGKSTHIQWLVDHLQHLGHTVVSTREPGGTPLGEQLRDILLNQPMRLETETLLMFAARCEHLETVIRPALRAGAWVVCDRFTDATYAYQGGGRRLGPERVRSLEQWVHPDLQPDRTWFFDVPLEVARERLLSARQLDRFEQEDAAFFDRTRRAYHDRVRENPGRFLVLDSTRSIAQIRTELESDIQLLREQCMTGHPGNGAQAR